jgi:polysaccharide export outer membrane protein
VEGVVTRVAALIAGTLLLPACFLAPGMRMNQGALEDRGRGAADPALFRVVPITPELLASQANLRAAETARRYELEGPPQHEYRISPHDVLSVIVWDHPELTIPAGQFRSPETSGYTVTAEGTIFFPHVGTLQVAGRTVEEVRVTLTERLKGFVRDPQLQVLVVAYRGKRAQVAGEVVQPSPVPITDVPLRVQDAIALAKGLTAEADAANVTLTRGGAVYHLDLLALYERGEGDQNWVLQDGDVVYVGDRSQNKVFVLGEVRKPSSLPMVKRRMTLADAIASSEGIDLVFANPSEIFVFRGRYDAPEIFQLDASSADALLLAAGFQLQPRDVVFVSTYNLGRLSRVLTQILPAVQAVWQTWDIVRRR